MHRGGRVGADLRVRPNIWEQHSVPVDAAFLTGLNLNLNLQNSRAGSGLLCFYVLPSTFYKYCEGYQKRMPRPPQR